MPNSAPGGLQDGLRNVAGKNVMITGPTNGIGRVTALELARAGAQIFLVCRDPGRGEALRSHIVAQPNVVEPVVLVCDLGRQTEIRRAAKAFLALDEPLQILINNAGIITTQRREGEAGVEQMFSVNHLGHFLLTTMLLDALKASAPARIITVASEAYAYSKGIRFSDLGWHGGFRTFEAYGHSKLANVLFTRELARRLDGTGVTAHCLDPGAVATNLGVQNGWYVPLLYFLARPFLRSPEEGARTTLHLAGTEQTPVNGGLYKHRRLRTLKAPADDDDMARELWERSAQLVGIAG